MAISLAAVRSWWPKKQDDGEGGRRSREVEDVASERQATKGAGSSPRARTYAREAAALTFIASGLYLALALASYEADPLRPEVTGPDWVGPVGALLAKALVHAVGVVAWLGPLELMLVSQPLLADRKLEFRITRVSGDVLVAVTLSALVHIAFPRATSFGEMPLGGFVGDLFGSVMRSLFSTVGSYLIGLTIVGLILVERATFSFIEAMQRLRVWLTMARERAGQGAGAVAAAWTRARAAEIARREAELREREPLIVAPETADDIIAAFADEQSDGGPFARPLMKRRVDGTPAASRPNAARLDRPALDLASKRARANVEPPPKNTTADDETPVHAFPMAEAETPAPTGVGVAHDRVDDEEAESAVPAFGIVFSDPDDETEGGTEEATIVGESDGETSAFDDEASDETSAFDDDASDETSAFDDDAPMPVAPMPEKAKAVLAAKKAEEPIIVDTSQVTKTEKAKRTRAGATTKTGFVLPSTELLEPILVDVNAPSKEQLHETARLLERTLADYKIEGKVQEIWPGPTVTMYEVAPAPGTKVSRVASLADDLALALARKVRIVAPIPGKNRIGFEVPNERRVAVSLRELFESKNFMSMDAPLPCVLGRDIIGNPCFGDLSSMPHVIVAGATGAGKSVGLNVMLLSMLYRRTPEELRMLMIDPKVVELAPFDKIPHLLFPVVTDMKQAANALKWTVDEMERRYQLFADAGTRNIGSFNKWVDAVLDGEKPMPPSPKKVEAIAPDGTGVEVAAATDGSDVEPPKKLPFIVVVVDEFADLMMTHGKDVEASVARLAQKARAAGIHVILATQRPSVDVITGMIKANFPSRIAFRVVQRNDSSTILDQQGAEHLLGKGDMLVKLNGTTDVKRVQCPFATEDEVQRVTDYLRTQGEPEYDESIVRSRDDDDDGEGNPDMGDAEGDPLYDAAVRVVAETRRATTSFLQRKLGVGYNRAAKIIETMEKRGVIGPAVGTRPREVLISPM
jgi:DNA segregation ATPase FtsK/SpoIIIE-like protein